MKPNTAYSFQQSLDFVFRFFTAVISICFAILAVCFFLELVNSKQLKQERDYLANRLKTVEDSLAALPDSTILIVPTNLSGKTIKLYLRTVPVAVLKF